MAKLKKLIKQLDTLADRESSKFVEFDIDDLKAIGPAAALIEWKGEEHWIPFSQLREYDDQLYASNWILEQKGIEV